MPLLNDTTLTDDKALPTGRYGYSATRLEELGASEYTLVTLVTDVSPSVGDFLREMEGALRAMVQACVHSPRADNLLVRLVTFDRQLREAHGFKLLERCNPDDYRDLLRTGSATALYDAAENAVSALADYGQQLTTAGYAVNALVVVITDGEDNASTLGIRHVREALARLTQAEAVESVVSILVGVNVREPRIGAYLQDFKTEAGFDQYIEIERADAAALAGLADFVSRSISLQSRALGSGGGLGF